MCAEYPHANAEDIRRHERGIDESEWIVDFLKQHSSGVIGVPDEDAPYLVTRSYVYVPEDSALYFHGASAGHLYELVTDGPIDASCTVFEQGNILPADQPAKFSIEYESVVMRGTLTLVDEPAAKRRALERIMQKFAPHLDRGEDYQRMSAAAVERTGVYRLTIDQWTGKQNRSEDPPEDAYTFADLIEQQS